MINSRDCLAIVSVLVIWILSGSSLGIMVIRFGKPTLMEFLKTWHEHILYHYIRVQNQHVYVILALDMWIDIDKKERTKAKQPSSDHSQNKAGISSILPANEEYNVLLYLSPNNWQAILWFKGVLLQISTIATVCSNSYEDRTMSRMSTQWHFSENNNLNYQFFYVNFQVNRWTQT